MALKRPFRISKGTAESKKNFLVSIDDRFFGEAAGSVHYGPSEKDIVADLGKGCKFLESTHESSLDGLMDVNCLDINPVSKAALMGAVLHRLSSLKSCYPWEILSLDRPAGIQTSYTVSIDDPDIMYDEINNSPYPIIKIKLGFPEDELLVDRLRSISGKKFRIDANGGWTADKATRMIYLLDRLDVEIVEQPTAIEHIGEWKYIKGRSRLLLVIDEGLNTLDDYYRYAGFVDGVNIKMAKSGGIIEARKIALQAGKDKLKIMLGCMLESSVALSQAVYLSSLAEYFDLDGPLLLENDVASGIDFNLEKLAVKEDIIGGPRIREEYLHDQAG